MRSKMVHVKSVEKCGSVTTSEISLSIVVFKVWDGFIILRVWTYLFPKLAPRNARIEGVVRPPDFVRIKKELTRRDWIPCEHVPWSYDTPRIQRLQIICEVSVTCTCMLVLIEKYGPSYQSQWYSSIGWDSRLLLIIVIEYHLANVGAAIQYINARFYQFSAIHQ